MEPVVSAKHLEIEGRPIQPYQPDSKTDEELDRNWAKIAFMVSEEEIGNYTDIQNQYYTSAEAKFVDTRIGANIGINPRPQWTRYSDIRVKGRLSGRNDVSLTNVSGNYGLGRAYSENQDDPAQKIFMTFGVPKFSGLGAFLFRAFDREATIMARTGRPPTAWYTASKTVAALFATAAAPGLAVTVGVTKAAHWLLGRPTTKFFTIKKTMFHYWSTVNHLVNNHAVNTGIFKKVLSSEDQQRLGFPYKIDEDQIQDIAALLPDIFRGGSYIDVYSIANKAQRIANQMFAEDFARLDKGTASNFLGYLKRDNSGSGSHSTYISDNNGKATFASFLNNALMFGDYYKQKEGDGDGDADRISEIDPRIDLTDPTKRVNEGSEHFEAMKKMADAEFRDGSQWACFRVDYTGSVGEAFANSVAESDIQQKANSFSSSAREMRFTFQDGNITGGVLDKITSVITNIGMGALDGATFGFAGLLPGLGGGGYIDVPKHWQSSSTNLPRGSYTIKLISPYNNPISRMINIWIPFYMLLAGAMPRSTGKQSYTSPYYCQIFDRGRLQSRTAMIEQLRVTRGTSNLGFDLTGQALAIDVSLDIVDLSTIMHMPMSTGKLSDFGTDMAVDEDNIAADYLNVLAGMDLYSQIYPFPKGQLKMTKKLLAMEQKATSPAWHTALFKNSVENGFINDITFGASGFVAEILQAPVAGNSVLEGFRR